MTEGQKQQIERAIELDGSKSAKELRAIRDWAEGLLFPQLDLFGEVA